MADDLVTQINDARSAGHTDDDIAKYLSDSNPDVGPKIKLALQSGHTATDIIDHLAPRQQQKNDEEGSFLGGIRAIPQTAKDLMEGAGSGIISTGLGAYNLARKGAKAIGVGDLPEAPDFIKKAAAPTQYDAQGNPVQNNGVSAFDIGRTGEQAAEFLAPEMAAGKVIDAANIGSKALKIGAKVGADTAIAGGVSGVQTGGDLEKMGQTAIATGITSGAFNTIGGILQSIPTSAVYLKNLKFPTRFQGDRVEEVVGKAIDDGILISKGGANKAEFYENLTRAQRDAEIAKHANDLIDINIVRAPVMRLRQMAENLGEKGMVSQIDRRLAAFEEANGATAATPPSTTTSPVVGPNGQPITTTTPGTPAKPAQITMRAAQQAKDDFNLLAQNMFGKFSPGAGEIRKLMGAGIKDAMEAVSPEIRQLNRDTQSYKLLKNAINKYVDSNPDLLNPRTAVLAIWNKPAALIYGAFANPFIRSALAIAKDRVEQSSVPVLGNAVQRTLGAVPTLAQQGPDQQ
jgi:hypothetical protein